jgi:hypothetical protein
LLDLEVRLALKNRALWAITNVDQCARAGESKGKRLNGGYAIVGSAFGGKRVAARWTTRLFVGFERREPGLFCEPAEDYDKTSNHQWRTVSIIDDA